jgi:hypothetical protein
MIKSYYDQVSDVGEKAPKKLNKKVVVLPKKVEKKPIWKVSLVREERAAVLPSKACVGGFLFYTRSSLNNIVRVRGYVRKGARWVVSPNSPISKLYCLFEEIDLTLKDSPLGADVPKFIEFLKEVREAPVIVPLGVK